MSSIVRNASGSGILSEGSTPGCALYARTRAGENNVIAAGSFVHTKFRSRLCSQLTPKRMRCTLRCHVMDSLRWNRRPRLSSAVECPMTRPACGMVIDGAPSPTHPAQFCSVGASRVDLMTKEENRRSLTSVGRRTLVRVTRLWSARATTRFQFDGYAFGDPPVPAAAGPNAWLPSYEWRANRECEPVIFASSRTLNRSDARGLPVTRLKWAKSGDSNVVAATAR